MGRPRYTSPAEQIVWLEHHVEELEAENQRLSDELKLSEETIGEFNVAELKAETLVAELEAENQKLQEIIVGMLAMQSSLLLEVSSEIMKPAELLDEDFKKVLDDNRESLYEKE